MFVAGYAPLPHGYPGASAPSVPLSAYYPSMDPLRMGSRPNDGAQRRRTLSFVSPTWVLV
jgi:hypothetical protein